MSPDVGVTAQTHLRPTEILDLRVQFLLLVVVPFLDFQSDPRKATRRHLESASDRSMLPFIYLASRSRTELEYRFSP